MWKWKIGRWLFRSGPASDQMIKRLQEAALALEKIPASTEHEFVAFGEDLQRFHAMAGHIAKLSFKIAKQMSDDSMQSGISGLQYIFNRILELDERSRSGAEALGSMLTGLEVMQHQLQAFARIIRNLHVLCRLIRIESARFDLTGQEFQTLADDVNKLTQEIETSLRRFQEQSDAMVAMIRGNYSRIGLFRGGQQENGRVILDHAVGDIKSLEEQNRLASRILTETPSAGSSFPAKSARSSPRSSSTISRVSGSSIRRSLCADWRRALRAEPGDASARRMARPASSFCRRAICSRSSCAMRAQKWRTPESA